MVIDGQEETELEGIDLKSSLYKIRKKISQEFPALKEKYFAFTKKLETQELLIPSAYENESAIRLEQVVKEEEDSTKFYIKRQGQ